MDDKNSQKNGTRHADTHTIITTTNSRDNNSDRSAGYDHDRILASSSQEAEEEDEMDLEWEEWDPSRLSFTDHMLAGSFAGLAEHICIYPMDTLKTNMQCEKCDGSSGRPGPGPFQTVRCAQRIVQQSGVLRLWRGVGAMFAGCIPAHAAYFSLFESMKVALGADREGHYPLRAALCGASATLVHDLMMTPFDVVKQRMQLGYHRSVMDCARTIVRTEGLRAFYLSFPTTVAMNMPYGCVMVAVNESSRKLILEAMAKRTPVSSSSRGVGRSGGGYSHSQGQLLSASMLSGGVAGAVAALVTTPLDVVKTRLQTQNLVSRALAGSSMAVPPPPLLRPLEPLPCPKMQAQAHLTGLASASCSPDIKAACVNSAAAGGSGSGRGGGSAGVAEQGVVVARRYLGMGQTFRAVVAEEGALALLRGAVPRILVQAPSVAISWTAYEFAKSVLAGAKQVD